MGWFSSLVHKVKNAVKAAVRIIRTIIRIVVKLIIELVYRLINLLLFWLPIQKKMRAQILILRDEKGIAILDENDPELKIATDHIIQTFKDECNIKVKAYGKPFIQTIQDAAPSKALNVGCDDAWKNEFGKAGSYFSDHLAGWNLIPISLGFPITIFVVKTISGKIGCSLGPLTDYVTVSPVGAKDEFFTMAHEMGHACGLSPFNMHSDNKNNLMFASSPRGKNLTGWQKFLIRGSRHCTFW